MKRSALYFTAPFEVELAEEPMPALAAGRVLVQTIVSAISSGTELLIYRDQMPAGMKVDATIGAMSGELAYPLKYGYAAAGRVVELGAGVDSAWRDRLVFAFHPHESAFVASPSELWPLPDSLAPEAATFLPNMETAVSFLMDGRPVIGERVIVLGQGIVGLLATTLLARLPLASLVTFDYYSQRRRQSLALGASASFDPAAPEVWPQARQALLAPAAGDVPVGESGGASDPEEAGGADLTFELSGNPAALNSAIALSGYGSRIVVGSWYGSKPASLDLGGHFHRSHIRLISSQVSRLAPRWRGRWSKKRRLQVAQNLLSQLGPESLISHQFPIERAAEAYQLLDKQPAQALQVILTYAGR